MQAAQPRRLDEDPWLQVAAQILTGYFVGFLLAMLGVALWPGETIAHIDDPLD